MTVGETIDVLAELIERAQKELIENGDEAALLVIEEIANVATRYLEEHHTAAQS